MNLKKQIVECRKDGQSRTNAPFQPEFPPEAETVLPPDVWAKLKEIKASSASIQEKRAQIHAVMQTVPDEVLDKLPEPKEFAGLPAEVGVK